MTSEPITTSTIMSKCLNIHTTVFIIPLAGTVTANTGELIQYFLTCGIYVCTYMLYVVSGQTVADSAPAKAGSASRLFNMLTASTEH